MLASAAPMHPKSLSRQVAPPASLEGLGSASEGDGVLVVGGGAGGGVIVWVGVPENWLRSGPHSPLAALAAMGFAREGVRRKARGRREEKSECMACRYVVTCTRRRLRRIDGI